MAKKAKNVILVEWKFKGERRHQACQSDAELASCVLVLTGLAAKVHDIVVWSPELVDHLTQLGRCGHA